MKSVKNSITEVYDISKWATSLGFPGAEDPLFKKQWTKLVCPMMRCEWRHLVAHIVSLQEAKIIYKQLLLYKLKSQTCGNGKILNKFNNVKAFETYLKTEKLRCLLASYENRIKENISEIKELQMKLEINGEKIRTIEEEERQKWYKWRLLQMKTKDIKKQICDIEQMNELVSSFSHPSQMNLTIKGDTTWTKNVEETLKTFTSGMELEEMSQHLKKSLNQKLSSSEMKRCGGSKMLIDLEREHIAKADQLKQTNKFLSEKISQLNKAKMEIFEKIIQNQDEKPRVELHKNVLERKIKYICEYEKVKTVREITNNWRNSIDSKVSTNYTLEMENTAKLESEINEKFKNVQLYCQVDVQALADKLNKVQAVMKKEASSVDLLKEMNQALEVLSKGISTEIELFLKLSLNGKADNSEQDLNYILQSLSDHTIFNTLHNKVEELQALSGITMEFPVCDLGSDIVSLKEKEKRNEIKSLEQISDTKNLISNVKLLNKQNSVAIEYWIKPPFADYIPGHPNFSDLKKRYTRAIEIINKCKH